MNARARCDFHESMPPALREHLVCRVVESLRPIVQKHDIEGLVLEGQRYQAGRASAALPMR